MSLPSYEGVCVEKGLPYTDALFNWHLGCLFSQVIQKPSGYSLFEGLRFSQSVKQQWQNGYAYF